MPKHDRADDEGNPLLVTKCRCILRSETEHANMVLVERLYAEEEEGRLKRQKQEGDDAKLAMGVYKIECVCLLSLSFSLSLSFCRNLEFVRGGTLIKHILAASQGKIREPAAAAEQAAKAEDVEDLSHGKSPRDALAAQARHMMY